MSEKLTPKQEKFAQGVASGLNQADAYRAAFNPKRSKPETIHQEASRIAADRNVSARIKELTGEIVDKARAAVRYDLEDALREADAAYQMALRLENPAAMSRAVELKSRLQGLMAEDRKNNRRPLDELTDDQLEARITRLSGGAQPASVH